MSCGHPSFLVDPKDMDPVPQAASERIAATPLAVVVLPGTMSFLLDHTAHDTIPA